jgi:hypothetical protein
MQLNAILRSMRHPAFAGQAGMPMTADEDAATFCAAPGD